MKLVDKAKSNILEPLSRLYYIAIAALVTAIFAIAIAVSK